jgi:hypothetical protein
VSAALDLLAGWSLLAAAGWARHVTSGGRALAGCSGGFWFLATPQVVAGPAGHAAALLGAAWLAPLATALLGVLGRERGGTVVVAEIPLDRSVLRRGQ